MAGVIGMSANNNQCGVGVAYQAKISGKEIHFDASCRASNHEQKVYYSPNISRKYVFYSK